jgi:hypothetical protein
MLNPIGPDQEMWLAAGLMGMALVLFGAVMLLKPGSFLSFGKARLKAHGGISDKQLDTWKRWHRRGAAFCVLLGMVVSIASLTRILRPTGPFAPKASVQEKMKAFSMRCHASEVRFRNTHTGPIWVRASHPSVFGAVALNDESVRMEPLSKGFVLDEPVDAAFKVDLQSEEVLELQAGQERKLPLLGLSNADCGAGIDTLALSPQGLELGVGTLQESVLRCDRLQIQIELYENPNESPSFEGWRGCRIEP